MYNEKALYVLSQFFQIAGALLALVSHYYLRNKDQIEID